MSIHQHAAIHKSAKIGKNVTIGPFTVIGEHVVVGDDCEIGPHVVLDGWTDIGKGCKFFAGASIGSPPQDLKYNGEETHLTIGDNNVFREYVTVNIGTVGGGGVTKIGNNCLMMAYSHVAHDCLLGNNIIIANCSAISGHVTLEDHVIIGGLSGLHQFVRVGTHAIIGGCSGVPQDVPPYMMASGERAKIYGLNSVGLKRHNVPEESIRALHKAHRLLFRSKLSIKHALIRVKEEIHTCPEVKHLVEFIESSERGVCHGAS